MNANTIAPRWSPVAAALVFAVVVLPLGAACGGGDATIASVGDAGLDAGGPADPNREGGASVDGGGPGTPFRRLEGSAVNAGGGRTCAIIANGSVKCWGSGILGTSSTRDRLRPALILGVGYTAGRGPSGADDPITSVGVGVSQICLLAGSGSVSCFGDNKNGEIGDGTREERREPALMLGVGTSAAALAAGNNHTCILTKAGGVRCVGHNIYGQLGDGTKNPSASLVDVVGMGSGIASIAAGVSTTCAILAATGGLSCWGANTLGQLGTGSRESSALPVPVTGLTTGVAHVALGWDRSCAVLTSGAVRCWGTWAGYDGTGYEIKSNIPLDVPGLPPDVIKVAVGDTTAGPLTCALTASKKVYCWGIGSLTGTGLPDKAKVPTEVAAPGAEFVGIEMGQDHTCGVTTNVGTLCWGGNGFGQLGDGTKDARPLPTPVPEQ